MQEERILITVRTYPTLSAKYIETVCSGGITDSGEWRRLYPVPLRYLNRSQQYRTYDLIAVRVRAGKDGRPETRSPDNPSIRVIDSVESWEARHQWVGPTIMTSLAMMQEKRRTLGPVRVSEVLALEAVPRRSEWTEAEKQKLAQAELFEERLYLEKTPFTFRIRWRDGDGEEHSSKFEAWEVYQTWRKYRHRYADPIEKLREAWMDRLNVEKNDLSFFMGNMAKRRNVWLVCGVYHPPRKEIAGSATLWETGI